MTMLLMLKPALDASLIQKPLDKFRTVRGLAQYLDGNHSAYFRVHTLIDLAHAPFAELFYQAIFTDG